MANLTNHNPENETLVLESYGLKQLSITRKWTMFASILGFIFLALMLVLPTIILSIIELEVPIATGLGFVIPCLIMGVLYYFPIYFLFQFSNYSKKALMQKSSEMLALALKYLKMHYRYMGILIIVVISLYTLMLAIMLASGKFPPLSGFPNKVV